MNTQLAPQERRESVVICTESNSQAQTFAQHLATAFNGELDPKFTGVAVFVSPEYLKQALSATSEARSNGWALDSLTQK